MRVDGGPVQAENITGTPISVVGDPPQWSDDSDATYALDTIDTTGGSQSGYAYMSLDPIAGVTAATLHIRARTDREPGAHASAFWDQAEAWVMQWPGEATYTQVPKFELSLTPQWFEIPLLSGGAWALADVFSSGARLAARNYTGQNTVPIWHNYFYEAYLEVTVARRTLVAPPRRLSQRGDGLTGGAPRLTGSRSRQASNRLLGGYL